MDDWNEVTIATTAKAFHLRIMITASQRRPSEIQDGERRQSRLRSPDSRDLCVQYALCRSQVTQYTRATPQR